MTQWWTAVREHRAVSFAEALRLKFPPENQASTISTRYIRHDTTEDGASTRHDHSKGQQLHISVFTRVLPAQELRPTADSSGCIVLLDILTRGAASSRDPTDLSENLASHGPPVSHAPQARSRALGANLATLTDDGAIDPSAVHTPAKPRQGGPCCVQSRASWREAPTVPVHAGKPTSTYDALMPSVRPSGQRSVTTREGFVHRHRENTARLA
ncbi:hypothetical protein C2E23DRAFT_590314 [Lenzites betulinus]|nr:hypothetical protein C2E23DRAFT_590314 [Lenzites betulinus]